MRGFLPKFLSLGAGRYSPKDCAKLFDQAKESIKIVIPNHTGIDFFWSDAISESLKRAVKRGVTVKIAYYSLSEVGKVGIMSVPGVEIFRLEKPRKRLVASIDAQHAIVQRERKKIIKIDVGLILNDVGSTLAHEIDATFDELTVKKGSS